MDGFLIIANIIFIILLLISSLLTIISLPGNILLLISMLLYGLYDNFIHLTYYDILIESSPKSCVKLSAQYLMVLHLDIISRSIFPLFRLIYQ